MTPLAYILVALATYRVATDVAWEGGPFGLFAWWRGQAIQNWGPDHWIAEGIACPICISLWVAPLMFFFWALSPLFVAWLAVAGAAAALARVTK